MRNHEKVQSTPLTSGEIFEFAAAVVEQLPRDLDPVRVRYYTAKKGRLGKALREVLTQSQKDIDILEWQDFFRRVLGHVVDLGDLHIPEKPNYQYRALIIPRNVTENDLYDACASRFKCWKYADDLNAVTDIVSRPEGPYVIWVKDTQEAGANMANISADDINRQSINTETLKERLIHELKFHDETGKHLDVFNWTLCAGSRDPDGSVPGVGWDGDCMGVRWWGPGDRRDYLRARVAVS